MSDIPAIWRDLHNLCAQFDALVQLRDLYARARATESQALGMDERLQLVTKQAEDKQVEFARLREDVATIAERYKAREAGLEADHKKRQAVLDVEHGAKRAKLQEAHEAAKKLTDTAVAELSQSLSEHRAKHQSEMARLASEENAARAILDQVNKTIQARQDVLERLKGEARKLAG